MANYWPGRKTCRHCHKPHPPMPKELAAKLGSGKLEEGAKPREGKPWPKPKGDAKPGRKVEDLLAKLCDKVEKLETAQRKPGGHC